LVTDLELPAFDYATLAGGPSFHETLESLRARHWLARADPIGFVVLDRESAAFFMRSRAATFPGRKVLEVQGVTSGPLYERLSGNLLDRDGEDHRRLRKLVQPAFSPAAADALRPAMRDVLAELWERLDGDSCDFVSSFARPYPAMMIATVMGAPREDAERLGEWANTIQGQFDPAKVANELPDLDRAANEFQAYALALISLGRVQRADDVISTLLEAEEEGDRLGQQDVLDVVSSALVGGVDTTQAQFAHAIRLFAEQPDQWRLLGEDASPVEAAVEEVLRFEPITPLTARIVLEDLEHRDVSFPEGTLVFACAATANRDPDEYERPDEFDITADRGRAKPLTFGAGPHFCLGANLARAELQEALRFLAPRMRHLSLDGEPEYDTPLGVYGLRRLPIRFELA
jgi:cytochrome P450